MKLIKAYYLIVNAINEYDLTDEQKLALENAVDDITHILDDLESEGKYFDH